MAKKKSNAKMIWGWILIVLGVLGLLGFKQLLSLVLAAVGGWLLYDYYKKK